MASLSIGPATPFDSLPPSGPPRHARKHSRHPTAAAPLPAFNFNPGADSSEKHGTNELGDQSQNPMVGAGHMRRPSKPAPLPEFSFNPGATLPAESSPSPSHPILEEMALNQHRVSKSARPAPLPAFTFNPSAGNGSTSPTRVESDSESTKPTGHRRGGSEFVGGKAENAQLVLASPQKHETKHSCPPTAGAGFRSHTHRRSQAISISDIDTSDLIKQHAIAKARAPSNPATPQDTTFSFPRASPAQRHTPTQSRSPPGSPRRRGSGSGYRPRVVDFSERVDVIPRPLSMISSETEMSNSTFRGHSVTNSINSIASPPPSSIPEVNISASPPTSDVQSHRRPNTADASLLLAVAATNTDANLLSMPKRPLSASGSPMASSSGSPPTKKKHFWSAHGNDPSPTPTPKTEKSNPMDTLMTLSATTPDPTRVRPKTAPERPSAHKRKKYHTWTAGIFSKKSKSRTPKKSRRSPTPPSLLRRDSDRVNDIFDCDDTVVLREESPVDSRKQPAAEYRYPSSFISSPTDMTSPMLDLDIAMQSGEEDRRHSDDNARTTTARIAKLHSSERRGAVDAFGVTHRRTESAPALSPVNRSSLFGMRQHGSNASLSEDVFDEEEEDNFLAHEKEVISHDNSSVSVNQIMDVAAPAEDGLGLRNMPGQSDGVVIVDPDEAEAEDVRSSKSTIEAPMVMGDAISKRPSTSPMPFAYPDPQLHYASSTEGRTTSASLISSPDADHISFDVHTRPRRFGELGLDSMRPSTEDIPSLSDSASSNVLPRVSSGGNARPSLEQRSNSMFVPSTTKLHESWKRSSLASLNRLIPGSAHGSKLKLETLPPELDEKNKKKSNRISKLMRFWRAKEVDERPRTSAQ